MTKFLSKLITDDTPILKLDENIGITREDKLRIIDIEARLADLYIRYLYLNNGQWYYFKEDCETGIYPFSIIDELMGSYLARLRDLPTVLYQVSQVGDNFGLASVNFKDNNYKYFTLKDVVNILDSKNLDGQNLLFLRNCTIDSENEQNFLRHLFDLFSLDIHMLQMDRGFLNLQFQINKENNYFDIAPIYDYSNCRLCVKLEGIDVPNQIHRLNETGIAVLLEQYPTFKERLEYCLDCDMVKIWDQICLDYHFNQESSAYDRVKDYYEVKEVKQKQYIKFLLNK